MKIGQYDITAKNIRSFIVGTTNKMGEDLGFKMLDCQERIQAELRSIACFMCSEYGKCVDCKCTTPDMYYDQSKVCSTGRWGPMMNNNQWD
jgi:hypothetical protein